LPGALRPDHVLEMAVARLASLPEAEDIGRLIARLDELERGTPGPPSGGTSGGGRALAPADTPRRAPASQPAPRAPAAEAQRRGRAKEHPAVQQAVELLDAELREVHVPRELDRP